MTFQGDSSSSKGLEMDQKTAQTLFHQGAALILLDVPVKTEFGIDLNSWNTGARFKGVKMIPPGLHFVYYSSVNETNQTGPRSGFFHHFSKEEIVVKRWNTETETLQDVDVNLEHLKTDLRNLDKNLAPYPYDNWKKWISLTNHISDATLGRLEPKSRIICSASQFVSEKFVMKSCREKEQEETTTTTTTKKKTHQRSQRDDELPKMEHLPGTNIRYTTIPPKYTEGSSPEEITKNNMDTTFQLETFIQTFDKLYGDQVSSSMSTHNHTDEILAELQFSFICFLVAQNYDSFEQWKNLIAMLCGCDDAISKYPDLYSSFISDLHFQIREVPDDFFVDIVSSNNFLVSVLTRLFSTVRSGDDGSIRPDVKKKFLKFQAHLNKKFDWDFGDDDCDDEDLPVVVETE